MAADDEEEPLVEESTVTVVSSVADTSNPTVRQAHFLRPRAVHGARPPALPSSGGPVLGDGLEVEFRGWEDSPKLWRRWVAKQLPRHEALWRRAGILDAVLATRCRVRRDEGVLLQLAAFWSGENNTFVFPWGEATVTLEDVAVLGGLPLLGKPVRAPPPAALRGFVDALEAVRRSFYQSKNHTPNCSAWAKYFLDRPQAAAAATAGGGGDADSLLEHGAFLAMWLSLFVLPAPPFDVVRAEVLPIAARLACGQGVALAPAALASIYSDLSALKRYFELDKRYQPFVVWAPLHNIVQLWAWERFPELRPEPARCTSDPDARAMPLMPRAARWHDVHKELDPSYVHAVLILPKVFEWRPYGSSSFTLRADKAGFRVRGRDIATSKQLLSFTHCLRPCELVGMRCIEHYRPHRVARQLSFDQDVPGSVARVNTDWVAAWQTYKMEPEKFAFIVPKYKPAVTIEYAQWWKSHILGCATSVANVSKLKELAVFISQRKRKMDVHLGSNSGKKAYLHTEMTQPDIAKDSLVSVPVCGRLNNIIPDKGSTDQMVRGAARSTKISTIVKDLVRNRPKRKVDVPVGLVSEVNGSTFVPVNKTDQGNSLQEIKEEAPGIANYKNKRSSVRGEIVLHQRVEGAENTGSNQTIGSATVFEVQSTLEDIVVISDDDFEDEVGAMHLKLPQFETATLFLEEPNVETQLMSTSSNEQGNPVFNNVTVQSNCDHEIATVARDITLSKEPAEVLDVVTIQPNSNILQGPTEEMQTYIVAGQKDKRDIVDKDNLAVLEGNEEEERDVSASLKKLEIHVDDSIEVNRNISGNNDPSSLIDVNTELVRRSVCTETLYYVRPFDWLKCAQAKDDANGTDYHQGAFQPKREAGTREMIEEASEARQSQKVELQKIIDCLKKEIAELEVRPMDGSPSKTCGMA